jgi:DNA-binding GntR family transcriptional regulator
VLAGVVPATKGGALHAALRDAILSAKVPPGSQLSARELAEEIGVSVIPIREALHRLAAEGLVTIRPHVGAFVTELPTDRLIELLEMRLVLECYAIERAVGALRASDFEMLDGLLKDLDADLAAADWGRYAQDNRRFHRAVYELCGSAVLKEEIDRLFALSERGQVLFALDHEYAERSQAEHRELMEAMRSRDAGRAGEIMARHRRRNIDGLRRVAASSGRADGQPHQEEVGNQREDR